jgi:diguanylate cyclase (GGDEF)-like protein
MSQDGYRARLQKASALAQQLADEMAALMAGSGQSDRAGVAAYLRALAERDGEVTGPYALLLLDLDRFHRVTARFGESGGEELLSSVGERVTDVLGDHCQLFARIGGDRFAAVLAGATEDSALVTAERVSVALRSAFTVCGEQIFVSASIGIASVASHRDAAQLLHDAESAIGQKASGGNSTVLYRPGMDNVPAFQLLRERDVRLAVEREEFVVHFQPVVDAEFGKLRAFEALLRWINPEEGLLPPSMFLDILRETGLIEVVGRRVLEVACEHAARWYALSNILVPVSVNIVPDQLYDRGFVPFIQELLLANDLPGEGLILELTEDALIEDVTGASVTLRALSELGVRVMIDDFGTGYSSLSYLHDLPVAGLKLDRGFFGAIPGSGKQCEIVKTIIALAHALGLTVVAEGIETQEQWTAVQGLHCDLIQGFHFARPLDAEQATRFLARELSRDKAA